MPLFFSNPVAKKYGAPLWILLVPISFVWMMLQWLRRWIPSRAMRAHVPVICIGNLHTGGTGKTPTIIAIAEKFSNVVIVSRGYKGALSKTGARVDKNTANGALSFGDEPWMIARRTGKEVFIGADRRESFRRIQKDSAASFILLDDGFQNLSIHKDLSLICFPTHVSPHFQFGLPAGDLREPFSALQFAHAALLPEGKFSKEWRDTLSAQFAHLKLFSTSLKVDGIFDGPSHVNFPPSRLGAFCGIGHPERFVDQVRNLPDVKFLAAYSDHHCYSGNEVKLLIDQAEREGITVFLTTEKDWHKAAPFFHQYRRQLLYLRVSLELPNEFWDFFQEKVKYA